jgi:hypothetical protein
MQARHAARAIVNAATLATPLGLLAALAGRCHLTRGPRGLVLATSYRLGIPPAAAYTVGNVIITRYTETELLARPRLVAHEERHSWQYVACLGLPLIPLYLLACGWSWLRGRDFARHNAFEQLAGLADGGYVADD